MTLTAREHRNQSSDRVTVATLNYDGLLHSGILAAGAITDLAAEYDEDLFTVVSGDRLEGKRLRRRDDLTSGIELVNLHGQLGVARTRR